MSLEAATGSLSEEAQEQIRSVAEALADIADDCDLTLSSDEAYHLLLAIQCNAHQIENTALGLFPMTSMMNHSCDPNCIHAFCIKEGHRPVLTMRALRTISRGEELCYNYVPLYQSTAMRQSQLFAAYSFVCSCRRCQSATSALGATGMDSTVDEDNTFPVDDFLSLSASCEDDVGSARTLFRASSEVATCQKLLKTAVFTGNMSALKSIVKKLVVFCGSTDKAGTLHMCNEIMFGAYNTIAKACSILLQAAEQNTESESQSNEALQPFAMGAVGFGALALGCLLKFTKVRNDDVAELEDCVGRGLALLDPVAVTSSPQHTQDAEVIERLVRSDPPSFSKREFIDAFSIVAMLCLKHQSYFWNSDPRITELMHLASKQPYSLFKIPGTLSSAFKESSTASRFETLE